MSCFGQKRIRNRHSSGKQFHKEQEFEKLEPRNMLTTLFLDFGDRFVGGMLSMTEDQYITELGGVQIGSNADDDTIDLTSFSDAATGIDAADLADIRAAILELVELAYAPFDVQVVELTSEFTDVNGTMVRAASSVAEAATNLVADTANDAYVFVTGTSVSPTSLLPDQFGIAPLDIGNSSDSTALIAYDNILGQVGYNPHNGSVNVTKIISVTADIIDQQTGLTFGLELIAADDSLPVDERLLNNSETMNAGIHERIYGASYQTTIFSRFDLTTANNVIGPTQNSYELLVENIGASNIGYVTGTGASDRITITNAGSGTVDVIVEAFETSDFSGSPIASYSALGIDASTALRVMGGVGADTYLIDSDLGIPIVIDGASGDDYGFDRIIVDANGVDMIVHQFGFAEGIWNADRQSARSMLDLGNGTTFSVQGTVNLQVSNATTLLVDSTETATHLLLDYDFFGDGYNIVNAYVDTGLELNQWVFESYAKLSFTNIETLSISASDFSDRIKQLNNFEGAGLKNVYVDMGQSNSVDFEDGFILERPIYGLPVPGGEYIVNGGSGNSHRIFVRGSDVVVDGRNTGTVDNFLRFNDFANLRIGSAISTTVKFLPGGMIDGNIKGQSGLHGTQHILDLTELDAQSVRLVDEAVFPYAPTVLIDGLFEFADGINLIIGSNANLPDQLIFDIDATTANWTIGGDQNELFYPIDAFVPTPFFFSGFETITGSNQRDIFNISDGASGPISIDGGNGDDEYNFQFTDTGSREIEINDLGTEDQDTLNVLGTLGDDVLDISNQIGAPTIAMASQQLTYEGIENLFVRTLKGDDVVNFSGSPAAFVDLKTNTGNDRVTITGTESIETLNVSTGAGRDRVFVRQTDVGTSVYLNTNNDDDFIFVGSTANQNDGDLNKIMGRLHVKGGINSPNGEDRLLINDHGATGDFDYRIHPTWIVNLPYADSPSRTFAGINYDPSIELVRLEGSDGENYFEVIASFSCPLRSGW